MAIIIADMGFFTDSYDLFCISLVTKIFNHMHLLLRKWLLQDRIPPTQSLCRHQQPRLLWHPPQLALL
ncbi:hypothetical protein Taro_021428 [Colocasia esculenta]|uniref:Uncharacterized protein n=1 Tax=Colocasia esculenta TaxID=4460 RepID=A0A843UYW0_COLES|nr:hypothetical protein [Colocasia esculenta]